MQNFLDKTFNWEIFFSLNEDASYLITLFCQISYLVRRRKQVLFTASSRQTVAANIYFCSGARKMRLLA